MVRRRPESTRRDTPFPNAPLFRSRMLEPPDSDIFGESRDGLETYKMFAHDTGWLAKLHQAVDSGLTAEAAVQRVQGDTRHRMQAITDPYLRERLADLDDQIGRASCRERVCQYV